MKYMFTSAAGLATLAFLLTTTIAIPAEQAAGVVWGNDHSRRDHNQQRRILFELVAAPVVSRHTRQPCPSPIATLRYVPMLPWGLQDKSPAQQFAGYNKIRSAESI